MCQFSLTKGRVFSFLICLCAAFLVLYFKEEIALLHPYLSRSSTESNRQLPSCSHARDKQIAAELQDIYKELARPLKADPVPVALQKLLRLAKALDPGIEQVFSTVNKSRNLTSQTRGQVPLLDACPEYFPKKYQGRKSGYPFFHTGWLRTNCNAKPFHKVITILLNVATNADRDERRIATVLKGINDTYPNVQIYLATKKDSKVVELAKTYKHVQIQQTEDNSKSGKIWNQLVTKVSTPYVFLGRNIAHFNWFARLERLVHVISTLPNVEVAGGAYRNTTGHWQVGCYQTKLLHYILEYKDGYYRSKNECMYCDLLLGPFVSKTNLFKNIKFDENLSKELLIQDWFLRVRKEDHIVMNCPDAMYFTADDYHYGIQAKLSKQTWLPLAKNLTLNRVIWPGAAVHKFSCSDIGYKCNTGITSSIALPLCCQEQQAEALWHFHKFCEKHHVLYELDGGTILNAAKMRTMLPWDIDGDLILSSWNFSLFFKSSTQNTFRNAGTPLSSFQKPVKTSQGQWSNLGYFAINTPDTTIEVWGASVMSNTKFLPPDVRHIRTQMLYGGHWVIGPYNPGLNARNRYGHEVYKHAQHWRFLGMSSSWEMYLNSGSFKKCSKPTFHGCLDKLPGDGNIPFFAP